MSDRDHLYQIATCPTSGFFSKTIEGVTGGRMTHAYLIDRDGTWSMETGGLIFRPFDYWGDNSVYSRFLTTDRERKAIDRFIDAHQDVPYDWFGDLIVGLDDLTPNWLNGFWHQVEHWEDKLSPGYFCSAFVDAAFTFAGFEVFNDGRPSHAVTPMDLYREFVNRGWA